MKRSGSLTVNWTLYSDKEELDKQDRELAELAVKAAENAYAPYSGFCVGSAILLENGEIVTGVNVENAAFPSGICAERSAVTACHSLWPGIKPVAIAIAARNHAGELHPSVSPCGNCRQVLAEEEHIHSSMIRIILFGRDEIRILENTSALLPLQFSRRDLGH